MKTVVRFILLLFIFLMIVGGDCAKNILEPPKAPIIEEMTLSAYEVNPNDTVLASVTATNPEEGVLQYEWTVEGGQLLPPLDREEIRWKVPAVGGIFKITVTVSNEHKSTSKSERITVRSFVKPYVDIQSPQEGDFIVQFSDLTVQAMAQHTLGIAQVNLFVNDSLTQTLPGNSLNRYTFIQPITQPAGPAEIKVTAVANTTGTVGKDSILVYIEGIIQGK